MIVLTLSKYRGRWYQRDDMMLKEVLPTYDRAYEKAIPGIKREIEVAFHEENYLPCARKVYRALEVLVSEEQSKAIKQRLPGDAQQVQLTDDWLKALSSEQRHEVQKQVENLALTFKKWVHLKKRTH